MPLNILRSTLASGALLLFLAAAGGAQALDLGVSVGGVDVGVSAGDGGASVGVGIGDGGLGVDLDVDLDGDGAPDTDAAGQSIQPLGQEGALRAVQANRALPLADILSRARLLAEGEIIDAQLIEVRRILVYQIKVLGKSGDVSELYFYARSGAPVAPK
jgi:hypothetical protein